MAFVFLFPLNFESNLLRFDGMVERGYFKDDVFDCPHKMDCYTCNTSYCNQHLFLNASCITCSSSINGNCAVNSTFLHSNDVAIDRDCKLTYDQPLCYTIFSPSTAERGCTSKLFRPMLESYCHDNKTQCYFCDFDACNYFTEALIEQPRLFFRNGGEVVDWGWMVIIGGVSVLLLRNGK